MAAKALLAATKAEKIELQKRASVEDALAVVFGACLRHWTENRAAALSGDPEGVHEMRVALRRTRVALSDFREVIPHSHFARMKRETKWLLGKLGSARNWDVFLAELLAPVEAARPGDEGLTRLRIAAEAERAKGYVQARRAIRSPRYSAFQTRTRRSWLLDKSRRQGSNGTGKSRDELAVKLAGRLLRKRNKVVLKLGRDIKKLSARERHRLRIALKKFRYTAEFFRSLYQKKREKAYFHALTRLQDSLGRMNDVVVADHLLKRLSSARHDQNTFDPLSTAAGTVARWYSKSASSSKRQAEANWREFRRCDAFW